MTTVLLALVVIAAGLVILSGVWVAVALAAAVWRVDRAQPHDRAGGKDRDE